MRRCNPDGRRYSWLAIAALIAATAPQQAAHAQLLHPANGAAPSFEVATIKPNHNAGDVFSLSLQPARFRADGAPLSRLIRFAYDVKSDRQVVNMPDWANSEKFDIDAKIGDAEVDAIKDHSPDKRFEQYRLMVQSLLAERFQMKVKSTMQQIPVYALVVAKNGPKLSPARSQAHRFPLMSYTAAGDLEAVSVSMAFFCGWLSGKPDTGGRVVVDATGLPDRYDFSLRYDPVDSGAAPGGANENQPAGASATDANKPPLVSAIQEQLGLKLESRKAPVEVMVIEHVERPSPN